MGRALHDAQEEVVATIIERTRQLWEARLEVAQSANAVQGLRKEMNTFGWLFAAPQFDAAWAIEQLLRVLELAGQVEPDFLVLERLRALSADFPNLTVQALTLITYRDDRPWMVAGHRDEIADILQNALTSGMPDAERIARDLINGLAARGEDQGVRSAPVPRWLGAETTQAGYGGVLGLVSIIVQFGQPQPRHPGTVCAAGLHHRGRPNNRSTPHPAPPPDSAARKGCAVAAQPSRKAATTSPSYLRAAEVADILHVSPKTVSRWAKEGKLPYLKTLGGHRRYPEAEIRDLAEGLREEATA
jgi:excisionase family DNA binding protein